MTGREGVNGMVSLDEMERMLEELAAELPKDFFRDLNGGILLLPESKEHPKSSDGKILILGEYRLEGRLGRYIAIYYGSFKRLYGHLDPDALKEKLRATLRHEFRHHLETLAGERALEMQDQAKIEKLLGEDHDPGSGRGSPY